MNAQNLQRLLEFDTPTVANGLELLRIQDPCVGYTGPDVRCLMPELGPRIGIAVTARLDTTTAGSDNPASLFPEWLRIIREAAQACGGEPIPVFAIMESVGPRPRYTVTIGDMMATRMAIAGAVGFLSNGSIRDIDGVRETGLACWGAGLSPMHGRLRWLDVNSPVVIDGMTVRPGDIVQADINGAIIIPPQAVDEVYEKAAQVRAREQAQLAEWRQKGLLVK
ncbi:MAG: hypothetical protein HYX94_05705 [Chloroflexi bacterium]|nr:hypothetical protein [Chloroflexota bacterium]